MVEAVPAEGLQRLSGEFLARVMHVLEQCQAGQLGPTAMAAMLMPLLEGDNVRVGLPPAVSPPPWRPKGSRRLSKAALERLNVLLPWCTLAAADDGELLGTLWSSTKPRPARVVSPAHAIWPAVGKASLEGQLVLDIGCFEGSQAIGFAERGARVWAVDGRIENVVKTLVRVWLAGLEHRVTVQWIDLEQGPLSAQLAERGLRGGFDLVHLSQVLDHLSNPVAVLHDCAALCHGSLFLNTKVEACADAQAEAGIDLDGQRFAVVGHRESKLPWAPFGGLAPRSNWLTRESLLRLLDHLGFPDIEIRIDQASPSGHRVGLLARRAPATESPAAPMPARFRKVLVVGLGRSGTSAVAAMLKACGFFMGDDLDPVLHESTGLRSLLKAHRHAEIDGLLQSWSSEHSHLAWKDPKLHADGTRYIDTLDNDWLVYAVFRDPVAVAQRRSVADGLPFDAAFSQTLASEARLREFVQRTRKRVVPVSYERLMAHPSETLGELLSHLELDGLNVPTIEAIWSYMLERRDRYRQEQAVAEVQGQAGWRATLLPDPQGG